MDDVLRQGVEIRLTVNGRKHREVVEPRLLLADFLRQRLGLTGTHLGCEQGVCGSCTVVVDGETMRSCLLFAAQMDGSGVETIEGLADDPDRLHPVQQAFWDHHGLQCGFCTPGMVLTAKALLEENPEPSGAEIREALAGNICRCTGYVFIVDSVKAAAETMASNAPRGESP
ncbi:MAG: (2Fe-2S)-binding protein [Acidimicrobiia bacterium]|nr:(2Fe-2S)-binding protein [Acidimicrobiia bacterium]